MLTYVWIRAGDEHVAKHRVLKGCADQATIDAAWKLLTRRCDILAPCAVERLIDAEVAAKLQCPVIAESANSATTPEADLVLAQRNDRIFVIPDADGVIVSCFEWVQGLQHLEHVLNRWGQVVARTAAMAIGVECVLEGQRARGLFP
jgi:glutamate dehydrogenase (NAD(P)+)